MLKFIRSLPDWAEFAIVMITCFGMFTIGSISVLVVSHDFGSGAMQHYDYTFIQLIHDEFIALFATAMFLSIRGWTLAEFDFRLTWRATLAGIGLVVAYDVIFTSIYGAIQNAGATGLAVEGHSFAGNVSVPVMLAVSFVNPIFEEIVVVGYVIAALERKAGAKIAILVSVLIRTLYHLYQGMFAVISIAPLGLLFALVYWRWRNLWPLILAHGILDFIALYRPSP